MKNFKKGNSFITYTISRVADCDDVYISVQNGEVEIIAPCNFTNKKIQKIIEEKRDWILRKIHEYNFKDKEKYNGIERNPLKILGKEFKMKINYRNIDLAELNVENSEIKITLSNKFKGKDNKKVLNLAIDKLYESIAEKEIERSMEKTRILLGYAPEDYKIEKMKNTYGKCVKNIITINPEVVKFNRKTIDKIVMEQFLKLKVKSRKIRNAA